MKEPDGDTRDFSALDQVLDSLQERAREFNCLVEIEEILSNRDLAADEYCPLVLEALIQACDRPEQCCSRIRLGDNFFVSRNFRETPWFFTTDITAQDMPMGSLSIFYWNDTSPADPGFFNRDKLKLFNTVAGRLGQHILHERMHHVFQEWESTKQVKAPKQRRRWEVVLELIEHTDLNLYSRIARKMLYHLCWTGVSGADNILQSYCGDGAAAGSTPAPGVSAQTPAQFASQVFRVAGEHLNEDEVLDHIQKWVGEDRLSNLVQVVDRHQALPEVADGRRRSGNRDSTRLQELPAVHSSFLHGVRSSQCCFL